MWCKTVSFLLNAIHFSCALSVSWPIQVAAPFSNPQLQYSSVVTEHLLCKVPDT